MSNLVSISTFVRIDDIGRFQNSQQGSISYQHQWDTASEEYKYLPFIYQGSTVTNNGNNLESGMVLANNKIAITYATEAVENKSKVKVATCLMNNKTWAVQKILSVEHWLVISMSYDAETIEMTLSSAVDAVGSTVPNFVLTRSKVGSLPTTGQITNS